MIIKTPSRLHMTLIDLNGSYGRSDGGIGLTLAEPYFALKLEDSERGISIDFTHDYNKDIRNECVKKITNSAEKILNHFGIEKGFHFSVENAYPNHSGLGSGTQIALATGKLIYDSLIENSLISKTFTETEETVKLAEILKRGGTSGIGVFSFDHGGFIVDGGHNLKEKGTFLPSASSPAKPPKLIGKFDFPEEWKVVVAIPNADTSVTGEKEDDLFAANCPVPKTDVEQLSHLIFMNLIPFLLEKDIEPFGNVINQIQNLGFKKAEISLQHPKVNTLMEKMREFGAYGAGMSSFGPATYGITYKNTKDVFKATKEYIGDDGNVFITSAQNHGHEFIG